MALPIDIPILAAVRPGHGWASYAVLLTMQVPSLGAVTFYVGRSVFTVVLPIPIPNFCIFFLVAPVLHASPHQHLSSYFYSAFKR